MTVVPRLDTFALLTLSAVSAGFFAAGDRLLGPAAIVPSAMGAALYPFMASRSERTSTALKLAGLLAILGGAIALAGIVAAPTLVPLLFGANYRGAVPTVRVLLLSLPLIYASSPLLVHGYSRGRERTIVIATLGISLLGTAAIITGQTVEGVTLAAAGYVLRQLLFLIALVAVGLFVDTGQEAQAPVAVTLAPTSIEGLQ